MINIKKWLSIEWFFHAAARQLPWLFGLGMMLLLAAMVVGLGFAPTDAQQGDAYRMMFVHVPCAVGGMTIYAGMAVCSLLHWGWHIKLADVCATAFAPVGAVLTVLALCTGAIWGQPMWGTWWVWDARLTSCLVLLFLYLGVMALRQSMSDGTQAARVCAWVTLVGALDLPIIHYSVNWWNTLHQKSTILALKAPTLPASMLTPLLLSLFGMAFWCIALGLVRMRTLILIRYRHLQWVQVWLGVRNA